MTSNNTNEYWEIDGVSLHRFGWSVATLGGRSGLPPLRGEDIQYAYRPGKDWRTKTPDSRVLSLGMWMTGSNPGTGIPSGDTRIQWNENWRTLKKLLWTPRSQVAVTRRIEYLSGIETSSARGQIAGTMEPSMTGRNRAEFVVDLLLSDPFFYGSSSTVTIPRSTPTTVDNPGDDVVAYSNFSLVFYGPLTNGKLTNSSVSPEVWVKLGSTVSSGDHVTLDVGEFTAVRNSDSANLVGGVSHSGSRTWMGLVPGDNILTLTSDSGAGHVDVVFSAPYL